MMFKRFAFFALIILPLLEISLFILVGQAIGLGWTLLLVIAGAVAGGLIVRRQGIRLLGEARATIGRGQLPARTIADGVLVTLAGVLIAVPGFLSDIVGAALLIPPLRTALYAFLLLRFRPATPRSPGGQAEGPRVIDLDRDDFRAP